MSRLLLLLCCTLAAACASPAPGPAPAPAEVPTPAAEPAFTIFLVRHAEKADGGRDPELSAAGTERALLLARMLAEVDFDAVHSTDYRRTRDTVAPLLALRNGAEPLRLYDPRDLQGFAARLRAEGGVHLVAGHSNTTPALVTALGGEAGGSITEDEYSRLYLLSGGGGAPVRTLLLRF